MFAIFRRRVVATALLLSCTLWARAAVSQSVDLLRQIESFNLCTLRLAIEDLVHTHGDDYVGGPNLLEELKLAEQQVQLAKSATRSGAPWRAEQLQELSCMLRSLKRRALLENPVPNDLNSPILRFLFQRLLTQRI